MTTIFADLFCNRDKNQAQAMLLPKRFRTNADYFLLHLVRVFFCIWVCSSSLVEPVYILLHLVRGFLWFRLFFFLLNPCMSVWACVYWNGVGSS